MASTNIMKFAIAVILALLTFGTMSSPTKRGASALKTMADLQTDDAGFVHVTKDGVARSYSENGTVIDFVQLNPAALAKFVATLPPTMTAEQKQDVKNTFAGVNGFDVKDTARLLDPPANLRPALESDEQFTSANEAFVATHSLTKANGGLPDCVGMPCRNTKACTSGSKCNKCMAPVGEHTATKWCHYV